jgi:hypothetical protein
VDASVGGSKLAEIGNNALNHTLRTLEGFSLLFLLSNTFKAPDKDSETISSGLDHTTPTCWSFMVVPSVQVVIAFFVSMSPVK